MFLAWNSKKNRRRSFAKIDTAFFFVDKFLFKWARFFFSQILGEIFWLTRDFWFSREGQRSVSRHRTGNFWGVRNQGVPWELQLKWFFHWVIELPRTRKSDLLSFLANSGMETSMSTRPLLDDLQQVANALQRRLTWDGRRFIGLETWMTHPKSSTTRKTSGKFFDAPGDFFSAFSS